MQSTSAFIHHKRFFLFSSLYIFLFFFLVVIFSFEKKVFFFFSPWLFPSPSFASLTFISVFSFFFCNFYLSNGYFICLLHFLKNTHNMNEIYSLLFFIVFAEKTHANATFKKKKRNRKKSLASIFSFYYFSSLFLRSSSYSVLFLFFLLFYKILFSFTCFCF